MRSSAQLGLGCCLAWGGKQHMCRAQQDPCSVGASALHQNDLGVRTEPYLLLVCVPVCCSCAQVAASSWLRAKLACGRNGAPFHPTSGKAVRLSALPKEAGPCGRKRQRNSEPGVQGTAWVCVHMSMPVQHGWWQGGSTLCACARRMWQETGWASSRQARRRLQCLGSAQRW